MESRRNPLADRAFRVLLRFFPSEFRGDYGREMEQMFQQQRRDASEKKAGILRLWAETIAGIFRVAPAEHVEMFRQDGGHALRMMRQNLGFTILVVFILALGIGANTAIFSVVDGVLLRPLPYRDGDRLVVLTQEAPGAGISDLSFSVSEIQDYREQARTVKSLVEYHNMNFDLIGQGEPRRVQTGVVSANFFDVLGVKPLLGRTFVPADEIPGAPAVLVFSYEYWKRNYGADPTIVGRTFRMNDKVHTVVGVLPPVPQYPDDNDVYMPTSACPFRSNPKFISDRTSRMMSVFGRLQPGVTLAQSQQELSSIAQRMQQTNPVVYPKNLGYGITPSFLQADLTKRARPTFLILLATSGLVLFVVCLNVANLSLARQVRRERELAIRAALGASRSRLLRQMVTESMILSLLGGLLGILLAWWGLPPLIAFAERFTPRAHEIGLDWRVLVFCLGISLLAGIIFGSIPASASQMNLSAPLKESSASATMGVSRQRVRNLLVVSQVALSFALLAGAGLMLRSFYNLTRVDPGFKPENVISMFIQLDWSRYQKDADIVAFHDRLLEKVNENPGVVSAAIARTYPLNETQPSIAKFEVDGHKRAAGDAQPRFDWRSVTPGYFRTMGIPLDRGRYFTDADGAKAPIVAIINRTMARHYWPGEDPLGHRVLIDDGKTPIMVVGVVGDVTQYGLDKPPADEFYLPEGHVPTQIASLLVRTRQDPAALIHEFVSDVYAIDPQQPVAKIRTVEQVRSESLAPARLTSTLLGCFALLALVITGAGVAGVMGLAVSQRVKEIGIRMALGATRADVLRMVLGQGLLLVGIGLAAGFALSLAGTRLIGGLLFRVQPNDPLTLVGVTLLFLAIGGAACYGPARRATGVDPLTALRSE
ncbi:MAG TPA: ABC transporter permease [Candidatus Acidoferrales bacterium]|nr:ABC transporter permease [Candidatus Acidoferrales bacterium]